MSEEMKMSEFFDLPVSDDFVGKMDHGQCVKFVSDGVAEFEAVVHAINNHDRLVEENARLTELAAQKASRADELLEALASVLQAESRNTGREPSLSVFHRAVGEALELIDKIKQESE